MPLHHTPPALTARSADRMANVVEAADAAVDIGASPNEALAKSASEFGLPVGHLGPVVRAFNTARAVRQLGETDVWAKAANHPVATEAGVLAILERPPLLPQTKRANTPDDYATPYGAATPFTKAASMPAPSATPTTQSLAQRPTLPSHLTLAPMPHVPPGLSTAPMPHLSAPPTAPMPRASLELPGADGLGRNAVAPPEGLSGLAPELGPDGPGFLERNWVPLAAGAAGLGLAGGVGLSHLRKKKKQHELEEETLGGSSEKPAGDKRLSPLKAEFAAAHAFDSAVTEIRKLDAAKYAAVRKIGEKYCPDATTLVFGRLEEENYKLKKQAAAAIDPTVTVQHPALCLLAALEQIKAAYVTPKPTTTPDGYEKVAEDSGMVLFRARPVCPILGRPVPLPAEPTEKVAEVVPPTGLVLRTPTQKTAGMMTGATSPVGILGRLGGSGGLIGAGMKGLMSGGGEDGEERQPKAVPHLESSLSQLGQGNKNLEQTAAIQGLLEDPRFAKANPKHLIETYHQLHSIAPHSMKNSAIAGDFVARRLATGPLSLFDLKTLSEIEKNIAHTRQMSRQEEEGD